MTTIAATLGGGLGNRLLGLASLLALAARHNATPVAHWPIGGPQDKTGCPEGFTCPFEALYMPPCRFVDKGGMWNLYSELGEPRHYSWNTQRRGGPLQLAAFTTFYTHGIINNAGLTDQEINNQLAKILPTMTVMSKVIEARRQMGEVFTGILVRCHGHPKARKWKPARRFTRMLSYTHGTVYMSCDDPSVARELKQCHQPMYTVPRPGRRNTTEELIAVAADIKLLAQAQSCWVTPCCAMGELVGRMRRDGVVVPS